MCLVAGQCSMFTCSAISTVTPQCQQMCVLVNVLQVRIYSSHYQTKIPSKHDKLVFSSQSYLQLASEFRCAS